MRISDWRSYVCSSDLTRSWSWAANPPIGDPVAVSLFSSGNVVHSVLSVASSATREARPTYFRSLANAIRTPEELVARLELPGELLEQIGRASCRERV